MPPTGDVCHDIALSLCVCGTAARISFVREGNRGKGGGSTFVEEGVAW